MTPADTVWPLALGAAGAIVGSFAATLVVRWPEGRSVMRGRSHCDGCGVVLGAAELVPLLSYAWRRGRCGVCGAAIDRRHPAIEGIAAAIGVVAGAVAPSPVGVAGAIFGWLLLTLAALDLAAWWLPDRLTATLAAAGVASGVLALPPPLADRLIGGVAGWASLAAIGWGYRRARGREGLGGGDPKLFGAIGLWLGWAMLPAVLLLACLIGVAAVGWRAMRGAGVSGGDAVPLGALLAIAAWGGWLAMVATGG